MSVCNSAAHSCAMMDRIITMGDTGGLDKVPGIGSHAGVIAGVLSEGPFIITKDPDSDWVNLGTYRSQLFEKDKIGTQFIKGKHADIMLKKYQALGEKNAGGLCFRL